MFPVLCSSYQLMSLSSLVTLIDLNGLFNRSCLHCPFLSLLKFVLVSNFLKIFRHVSSHGGLFGIKITQFLIWMKVQIQSWQSTFLVANRYSRVQNFLSFVTDCSYSPREEQVCGLIFRLTRQIFRWLLIHLSSLSSE